MARLKVLTVIPAVAVALVAGGCVESTSTSAPGADGVQLVQSGKLITCAHLPYAPFQYKDGDQVVGFDVDVVDFVGQEARRDAADRRHAVRGHQVRRRPQLRPVRRGGGRDHHQRRRGPRTSTSPIPYFEATQALLTKTGNDFKTLESLAREKVGVAVGHHRRGLRQGLERQERRRDHRGVLRGPRRWLRRRSRPARSTRPSTTTAVVNDYAQEEPGHEIVRRLRHRRAVRLRREEGQRPALSKVLNDAIKASAADGTYDQGLQKWIGERPSGRRALDPATPTTRARAESVALTRRQRRRHPRHAVRVFVLVVVVLVRPSPPTGVTSSASFFDAATIARQLFPDVLTVALVNTVIYTLLALRVRPGAGPGARADAAVRRCRRTAGWPRPTSSSSAACRRSGRLPGLRLACRSPSRTSRSRVGTLGTVALALGVGRPPTWPRRSGPASRRVPQGQVEAARSLGMSQRPGDGARSSSRRPSGSSCRR